MTQLRMPLPKQAVKAETKPASGNVSFGSIDNTSGKRISLYGTGGVGKTMLCLQAPGPVAFIDLDNSLPDLTPMISACPHPLDIRPVVGVEKWQDLRDALHGGGWDGINTIVLDTATRAEEMATEWVIENIPHEKGNKVKRIEDYGFGKGYRHIYDTFLTLLSDLDAHARAGRNVVIVCHECTTKVPNPQGDDYLRYEPRLSNSDKSNVRARVKEWGSALLFIGYDIDSKDGKARGSGTRTLWPCELPHCMAKCRMFADPMPLDLYSRDVWEKLGLTY